MDGSEKPGGMRRVKKRDSYISKGDDAYGGLKGMLKLISVCSNSSVTKSTKFCCQHWGGEFVLCPSKMRMIWNVLLIQVKDFQPVDRCCDKLTP